MPRVPLERRLVTDSPAASPERALAHFEALFTFETDCSAMTEARLTAAEGAPVCAQQRGFLVRAARADDLDTIVELCVAHAAYEHVRLTVDGLRDRLNTALFGDPPRVWCLVAEIDGDVEGYATFTRDYSTWRATEYLHVDCLYVSPRQRGRGIGRTLMESIARQGATVGIEHLEWQTPAWNRSAVAFYERIGATGLAKVRFVWSPAEM